MDADEEALKDALALVSCVVLKCVYFIVYTMYEVFHSLVKCGLVKGKFDILGSMLIHFLAES